MSTSNVTPAVKHALLEKLHREVVPELEQLIQALPDQLLDFAQAEVGLRQGMLKLAQSLLEKWAEVADLAVQRPSCPKCGVAMRNKGRAPSAVMTTWTLAKVASRLAAQLASFEEARDTLEEDYHVHLAKETVRDVAEDAGQHLLRQEDELRHRIQERQAPLPESTQTPAKACVFADGTTVHTEGEWHEIRVATAVTEDAEGNPLARQSRARFLPVDEVAWVLLLMAREIGYANAPLRAFIADGSHWLWRVAEQYFGSAVQILDWYHLAEHVHKAANIVYGDATEEATQWSKQLKDELSQGRGPAALELVQAQLAKARSLAKRDALQELHTYLENNLNRIDYPRYRELGLPIGSGQVEAQCKTLVGARCKQAGMRNWTYAGAEGVLRMRAAKHDGSFHALWDRELRLAA
jgi:hypothetical protein